MLLIALVLSVAVIAWTYLHTKWRERVQSVIDAVEKITYDDATNRGW